MPPGPFPLPVVGNFWMLRMPGVNLITLFSNLKNKYGKMFTLKIGSKPFIFINDLKLLQVSSISHFHFILLAKISPS